MERFGGCRVDGQMSLSLVLLDMKHNRIDSKIVEIGVDDCQDW